jgi:crossover junction endodeoxyribonuclease RuvC
MIILGIDPGTATTGFGIIRKESDQISLIDYGCIITSAKLTLSDRLIRIFKNIQKLIKKYHPDILICEEIFFFKNLKTAISVAQARGVVLLAAKLGKISFFGYTPLEVKQALSGYGRATKPQIQKMVQLLLKLKSVPKPDDAADALALAICHAHSEKMRTL